MLVPAATATAAIGGGTALTSLWGAPDGMLPLPDGTTAMAVGQPHGKAIAVTYGATSIHGGGDKILEVWDLAAGKPSVFTGR